MSELKTRSLEDWMHKPRFEETINNNPFREAVVDAFNGATSAKWLDPFEKDKEPLENKIAKLLPYDIIIPSGDVIYVMDDGLPIPLNEGMELLRAYLSVSMKETEKAAHILEQNFMGRWPVDSGKIDRNCFDIKHWGELPGHVSGITQNKIVYRTDLSAGDSGILSPNSETTTPELGSGVPNQDHVDLLRKVFKVWNTAVGEDHFFEKVCMYPFKLPFREKAFILNGDGGDGKGMFTNLLSRLYGHLMLSNAPVPSFSGHDKFTATRSFIGKKFIAFNDVGEPSAQLMDWLKPMTTGGMQVKEIGTSSLVTMPCSAVFMLETNFTPEFLMDNSHVRRYILRTFPQEFQLVDHMSDAELDILGERGDITSADMVEFLTSTDITEWTSFAPTIFPTPDYIELADEYQGIWTKQFLKDFSDRQSLSNPQRQSLKRHLEKGGKI